MAHQGAKVCISHAEPDVAWAEWIQRLLEQAGLSPTLQTDVPELSSLHSEDQVLVLLSPRYFATEARTDGWARLARQARQSAPARVLAVRVDVAAASMRTSGVEVVDLIGLDEGQARGVLLEAVDRSEVEVAGDVGVRFPAHRSSVWNLPPRNVRFVERLEVMTVMRQNLEVHGKVVLPSAPTGHGARGATQLALEFAHRYAHRYAGIWWIRAQEASTIRKDLFAGAIRKKVASPDHGYTAVIQAFLTASTDQDRILWVFDGAKDEAALVPYMPTGGHVIVTTAGAVKGLGPEISVPVWTTSEAVRLLPSSDDDESPAEKPAKRLAEDLGHDPLALALAAAYVRRFEVSVANYRTLLRDRLISRTGGGLDPVAATVTLTLDRLHQDGAPLAEALVELLACVASEGMEVAWIVRWASHFPRLEGWWTRFRQAFQKASPRLASSYDTGQAADTLQRLGLIERWGSTVGMHRRVQAAVRRRMSDARAERWIVALAQGLRSEATAHGNLMEGRALSEAGFQAHLRAVLQAAVIYHLTLDEAGGLHQMLGDILFVQEDFAGAHAAYRRALAAMQARLGAHHVDIAAMLVRLGHAHVNQGLREEAKTYFMQALEMYGRHRGPEHSDTATCLYQLVEVLLDLDQPDEARIYAQRLFDIIMEANGRRDPMTALALTCMGRVLMAQDKPKEAQAQYERTLQIQEAELGPDHPDTLLGMGYLAGALVVQKRYDEASEWAERALSREEASDANPFGLARALQDLAYIRQFQGRMEEASALCERALSLREERLGPHSVTAETHHHRAELYMETQDPKSAEQHVRRALEIVRMIRPPDHPSIQYCVDRLAEIQSKYQALEKN